MRIPKDFVGGDATTLRLRDLRLRFLRKRLHTYNYTDELRLDLIART